MKGIDIIAVPGRPGDPERPHDKLDTACRRIACAYQTLDGLSRAFAITGNGDIAETLGKIAESLERAEDLARAASHQFAYEGMKASEEATHNMMAAVMAVAGRAA